MSFFWSNGQNRIHPEARWPKPGTPFHASPRAPSYWPTPAQTRLWPNFKRVHPILATHPPIHYPISITPARLSPGYLYALHIFKSEKNTSAKNYIIIAPPQHDTLRCFLDVDSFQGGSFNLSENISDLISFLLSKFSSGQASILSFVVAVVDRC